MMGKRLLLAPSGTLSVAILMAAGMMSAPASRAQATPGALSHFEVASIRPVGADRGTPCPLVFKVDAARVEIRCMSVMELIEDAFGILGNRVTKPDWMVVGRPVPKFDIAAAIPKGASEDQVPAMLQSLLVDRFKLAVHRETKELPGYGLAIAKSGLKLKEASPDNSASPVAAATDSDGASPPASGRMNLNGVKFRTTIVPNPKGAGFTEMITSPRMGTVLDSFSSDGIKERLEAPNISLEGLADLLTMKMGQPVPVVDTTGVKGRYQLILEISFVELPNPPVRPSGLVDLSSYIANVQVQFPRKDQDAVFSAFQAALRKVGLQLEERKTPVETIVVDHLEEAPTEN